MVGDEIKKSKRFKIESGVSVISADWFICRSYSDFISWAFKGEGKYERERDRENGGKDKRERVLSSVEALEERRERGSGRKGEVNGKARVGSSGE